jgi:hypothetical protein
MKTVKIKVETSSAASDRIGGIKEELRWCWNRLRVYALRHQCLSWYQWAQKQSEGDKLYPAFDLSDIIRTPLMFARVGAWNYASCQIAVGGPYWVKDQPNTIAYKQGDKIKYKHSMKLVDGEHPYKTLSPTPYEPPKPTFKGAESVNMGMLNEDRKRDLLPELTMPCHYYYGLNADFIEAWAAYCDPKLGDRGQPLYKDGKQRKITCLYSKYPPMRGLLGREGRFVEDGSGNVLGITEIGKEPIICTPCDRTWAARLGDGEMRSYRLVSQPSGLYLCITVANQAEAKIPTVKAAQKMVAIALKKANPTATAKELKALREKSEEYKEASENVAVMQELATQLNREDSTCRNNATQTIKVKPSINFIAKTERLAFRQNKGRFRNDSHIAVLQQRLDVMRNCNNRKTGLDWKRGEREATKNELKLKWAIARLNERAKNSTNAFNQKLSTRLARMGAVVEWDELPVDKMLSAPEPILDESGLFWHPNGATAKKLMNRMLKNSAIRQLQSLTKTKAETAGKSFVLVEKPDRA